jgi:hypothetical protein
VEKCGHPPFGNPEHPLTTSFTQSVSEPKRRVWISISPNFTQSVSEPKRRVWISISPKSTTATKTDGCPKFLPNFLTLLTMLPDNRSA